MFLIYFRNGDWSNTRLTEAPSVKCTYNNQGIKETHKKEIFLKLRVKTLHKQFRHFETFKCFGDLQFYFLRAFVKDSSQIVAIFRDRIKVSETYNFICSDVI